MFFGDEDVGEVSEVRSVEQMEGTGVPLEVIDGFHRLAALVSIPMTVAVDRVKFYWSTGTVWSTPRRWRGSNRSAKRKARRGKRSKR